MSSEGMIVIGAAGTLAGAFRQVAADACANWYLFDYDADDSTNIAYCDLSDGASVEAAIGTIPITQHTYWRLLIASGVFDGSADPGLHWPRINLSLRTNLIGVTQFVCAFVQGVLDYQKQARLVVVTSAAARVGSRDLGYGMAKAGL